MEISREAIYLHNGISIFYVNDAAIKLFGVESATQLLGRSAVELYHPDFRSIIQQRINQLLAGEEVPIIEALALRRDGSTRDVEIRASYLKEQGTPIILVLLQDLTDLNRAERTLQESEERFKAIAESSCRGIGIVEIPEWRFIYANDAALQCFGYSKDDLPVLPTQDLYWNQRDREKILKDLSENIKVWDYEIKLKKKDGSVFWASVFIRPIPFNGKHALLCSFIDITHRKQAGDVVNRYAAEVAAANQNIEAFAYSITHDLRNPLHSILACAEVLKDIISLKDESSLKALDYITGSVERMGVVIADLIALTKIANRELHCTTCNVSEMAKSIIEELKLLNPTREVECIIEPGLITAADEGLLWTLLQNILFNAWKFIPRKPGSRIEVGKQVRDNAVFYFIHDTITGFDAQKVSQLFKTFHHINSEAEYSGSNIGMAIVKNIVEKHGGKLLVEAEANKGVTFYFSLGREAGKAGTAGI